jgi:hypothetical protein
VSIRKTTIFFKISNFFSGIKTTDFRLHPLIHIIPLENSLQNVGGGSQRANCELKYLCFKKTGVAIDNIAHTKYWEYADMVRAMR